MAGRCDSITAETHTLDPTTPTNPHNPFISRNRVYLFVRDNKLLGNVPNPKNTSAGNRVNQRKQVILLNRDIQSVIVQTAPNKKKSRLTSRRSEFLGLPK